MTIRITEMQLDSCQLVIIVDNYVYKHNKMNHMRRISQGYSLANE